MKMSKATTYVDYDDISITKPGLIAVCLFGRVSDDSGEWFDIDGQFGQLPEG
jgi:hypothetical protein